MFLSIVQSLTSLLLAGVFCYWIFVSSALVDRRRTQQVWLGIVLGVLVVLLAETGHVWDSSGATLDAKAGPLIMAGYLGGPVGAAITATIAGLYRYIFVAGEFALVGALMHAVIPSIGLVFYYLAPSRDWPRIPQKAIVVMLIAHTAWIFSLIAGVAYLDGGLQVVIQGVVYSFIISAIGAVSILVIWPILRYADRFAREAARSAALARRLALVLRQSKIGLSERIVGQEDAHFDRGLMSMYGIPETTDLIDVKMWRDNIHPDDYERYVIAANSAAEGQGDSELIDFRFLHPDGKQLEIRVNWVLERNAKGTPQSVLGLHADLTDVRNAERQHLRTAERLAVIAENLPGVMFQCDITDFVAPHITFISPSCLSIWGYSADELMADGKILFDAHDPASALDFLSALKGAAEAGEPIALRTKILSRDGEPRWLDFRGGVIQREGRKVLEAMVMDITREVEAQKELERERDIARRAQKNESIGLLTGGIAHDFNNLLAVTMGNLELLRDDEDDPQKIKLIDAGIAASNRGADLTRNMLSFARKAPLSPEVMDLNAVVADAQSWIGRTLPKSISVETSLQPDIWRVQVDRSSLESALLNLILNARDAMQGQGNLTIETTNAEIDDSYFDARNEELLPGHYVMLAVSDTGTGIPEKDCMSIFEPFFSTKEPGKGTGLGLSMVLGFMRQSGGTAQVYSEIGVGTTFKLYFPAHHSQVDNQSAPIIDDTGQDIQGKRILLAEDTDEVRDMLIMVLERAGCEVTVASTGDEAFEVFKDNSNFDLLLTDIVMPGTLQGTTLAKSIRALRKEMPVIFMSGYASEATVHGNGLHPEDIRLMKPVRRHDLLKAVREALQPPHLNGGKL